MVPKNFTILGAPGSGKGYYGKPLAEFLKIPLLTASSILRQSSCPDLTRKIDSGGLVDCEQVCNALLDFLTGHTSDKGAQSTIHGYRFDQGFMLDGFPRTLLQIELMQRHWPKDLQVNAAIHINIPDHVCQTKMMGRRTCEHCHRGFNVAAVDSGGFDLPPVLPSENDPECAKNAKSLAQPCGPDVDWWTKRKDDSDPKIVEQRLVLHRQNEGPITRYYEQQAQLLAYTPKRGKTDIPVMQQVLQKWLEEKQRK